MKRFLFFVLLVFAASSLLAKSPVQQNSEIEKTSKIWKELMTQYDAILINYEASSPKAQELEKKVHFSYTMMREAYSSQYSRCTMIYKKHMDAGVKKGAPMVKDLEVEIENLRIIGGKMKKSMTIDQQKELLKWMNENRLPQKIKTISLKKESLNGNNLPQEVKEGSPEERRPGERLVITVNGIEFAFRWCPPGKFTMGSPNSEKERSTEELQHSVLLTKGFWMMETEVTVGMFKAFVDDTGYESKGNMPIGWIGKRWSPDVNFSWRNPGFSQDDNHPVSCVSWHDAAAFCEWLSRKSGQKIHLPTEAQWEYACRAGSTGPYAGNLNEMAWYLDNSGMKTHPVGMKKPNAWGLYDMHGNLWEWCQDWHGSYPTGNVTDPVGPSSGVNRILRGGNWSGVAGRSRSAIRFAFEPEKRQGFLGFRVVEEQ